MNHLDVIRIFGGLGICDHCSEVAVDGYLCPVLGEKWYCNKCHDEWESRAINYVEDREYEKMVLKRLIAIIEYHEQ